MKKVLLSLAAVTAIAAAATPAAADHYRYGQGGGASIDSRQTSVAIRIDNAFRRNQISAYEANRLMAELRQVEALERRYRSNGHRITPRERQDLIVRINRIETRLRLASRDNNHRYGYGYGRW